MTDVSDIEELLSKAHRNAKRLGAIKMALVCLSTGAGAAFGGGVAAGKYLAKILEGQDRMLALVAGQDEKIKDLQGAQRSFADRLASLDAATTNAGACCSNTTRRVDALYAMPLQVRR